MYLRLYFEILVEEIRIVHILSRGVLKNKQNILYILTRNVTFIEHIIELQNMKVSVHEGYISFGLNVCLFH